MITFFNKDSLNKIDISTLTQFDQSSMDDSWNASQWESFLLKREFLLSVYFMNNEIVASILFDLSDKDTSHLLKISVNQTYRNSGIATSLLESSIEKLPRSSIYLEVRKTNEIAIAFYQKNFFKVIHEKSGFYSDGGDALIMSRRLQK